MLRNFPLLYAIRRKSLRNSRKIGNRQPVGMCVQEGQSERQRLWPHKQSAQKSPNTPTKHILNMIHDIILFCPKIIIELVNLRIANLNIKILLLQKKSQKSDKVSVKAALCRRKVTDERSKQSDINNFSSSKSIWRNKRVKSSIIMILVGPSSPAVYRQSVYVPLYFQLKEPLKYLVVKRTIRH